MDIQHTNAVSYATERDFTICFILLLESGVDPNVAKAHDIPVGDAINVAARNATDVSFSFHISKFALFRATIFILVKLAYLTDRWQQPVIIISLLDFGASQDHCGLGHTTALIHAARRDKPDFALLLVKHDANINAVSLANLIPLTAAVTFNSHGVLKLLLDRWFEYSECPRLKGLHLMKTAVMYGDVTTMAILTGEDIY